MHFTIIAWPSLDIGQIIIRVAGKGPATNVMDSEPLNETLGNTGAHSAQANAPRQSFLRMYGCMCGFAHTLITHDMQKQVCMHGRHLRACAQAHVQA
jgi:hypothetical protein